MLKHRLVTAVFGLVILVVMLLFAHRTVMHAFLLTGLALSQFEFSKMFFPAFLSKLKLVDADQTFGKYAVVTVLWSCLFYLAVIFFYHGHVPFSFVSLFFIVMMMFSIFTEKTLELSLMCVFVYILSVCYICLPWLVMQELYFMGEKGKYIFLLLTIVMLSDSGAYFCGVLFGKRKLAPRLSPNKTIEGALGGILFGVLGAIALDSLFNGFFQSTGKIVLLGIVCSIAGILGDLMESTFKRFSGVKDSGKLLPGHGGILDRVDSLLFAAPVLLVFIYLFER